MEKEPVDYRRKLVLTSIAFVITVSALLIALIVIPYLMVENAAQEIKQNMRFYGKSLEYVRGFIDGIEYFRHYLNDRASNMTAGV